MPSHHEHHEFVDIDGESLYVATYLPNEPPRAAAVFCLPIHEEQKSAYRPSVDAARAAADAGCACARFHYAGTDDSSGDVLLLTMERMAQDIVGVSELLRVRTGVERIALVGIRLGAAAALMAAEGLAGLAGVLAVEPVQNGGTYLSRVMTRRKIRKMVTAAEGATEAEAAPAPTSSEPRDEVIDFDGHPISAAQRASLEQLSLAERTARLEAPVLILEVAARDRTSKAAEDLAVSLTSRGARVATRTLVAEPFWNSLGVIDLPELTEAVVSFVLDPAAACERGAGEGGATP